jgi:hypothetical protein
MAGINTQEYKKLPLGDDPFMNHSSSNHSERRKVKSYRGGVSVVASGGSGIRPRPRPR